MAPRTPTYNDSISSDLTDEQIVDLIYTVEVPSAEGAWVRTGAIPAAGSSAWGPLQITGTRISDLDRKLTLSEEETAFVTKLQAQADSFSTYGLQGTGWADAGHMYKNHPTRQQLLADWKGLGEGTDTRKKIEWADYLSFQYTSNPNITEPDEVKALGTGNLTAAGDKAQYASLIERDLVSSWKALKKKKEDDGTTPTYKDLAGIWHGAGASRDVTNQEYGTKLAKVNDEGTARSYSELSNDNHLVIEDAEDSVFDWAASGFEDGEEATVFDGASLRDSSYDITQDMEEEATVFEEAPVVEEDTRTFEERLNATPVVQAQDEALQGISDQARLRETTRRLEEPEVPSDTVREDIELNPEDGILLAGDDPTDAFASTPEGDAFDNAEPVSAPDAFDLAEPMTATTAPDAFDLAEPIQEEEVGMMEAIHKASQIIPSFGLVDEMTGVANILEVSISGSDEERAKSWKQLYNEGRDMHRDLLDKAAKDQPWATGITQAVTGGAVLPSVVTKAGIATIGSLEGFGLSEEEDAAGLAKDSALGGVYALGGLQAFKGVAHVGGKALKTETGKKVTAKVGEVAGKAKKKVSSWTESADEIAEGGHADLRGKAEDKALANSEANELVLRVSESDEIMEALLSGDNQKLRHAMNAEDPTRRLLDEYVEATDSMTNLNKYGQDEIKELAALKKRLLKEGREEVQFPSFEESAFSDMRMSVSKRLGKRKEGMSNAEIDAEFQEKLRKSYLEEKKEYDSGESSLERMASQSEIDAVKRDMAVGRLRTDIVRYMHWATGETDYLASNKWKNAYKMYEATDQVTTKLYAKFQQAQKSGLANRKSFSDFKHAQYTMEAIHDIREDFIRKTVYEDINLQKNYRGTPDYGKKLKEVETSAGRSFDQSLAQGDIGAGFSKYGESHLVFREIDKHSGMDLEMVQNSITRAFNEKAVWDVPRMARIENFERLTRKSTYETSEIYDMMRDAAKGRIDIPDDAKHLVEAAQEVGYDLLMASRAQGLKVADLGEYYLPERKLSGAQYVRAMEDMFEEVKGDPRFVEMLLGGEDKLQKVFKWGQQDVKDIAGFVSELKRVIGKPRINPTDVGLFFRKDMLRTSDRVGKTLEVDAAALHTRAGDLPEFLLEKDIGKLFRRNVSEAGNLSFIEPMARQLDGRAGALKSMGKKEASAYVEKYRKDITGQYRPERNSRLLDLEKAKLNKDGSKRGGVEAAKKMDAKLEDGAALFDTVANSIYPNLVGMNPAAVTRNLLQPYLKTIPELDGYDVDKVAAAYVRAYKKIKKDKSNFGLRQSDIEGVTPTSVSSEIMDTNIMRPLDKSKFKGAMSDMVSSFNEFSMRGFTWADALNRSVTAEIGEDIARRVRMGDLSKINKFPPALRARALRVARSGKGYDPDFTKAVQDHLLTATQLIYGKAGNSQFVRESNRLMGMMSKWPTAIVSDVYSMAQDGVDLQRYYKKYFGPLLYVSAPPTLLSMSIEDDGETTVASGVAELLIGTKGGANYSPTSTLLGLNLTPPMVSGVTSIVMGTGSVMKGILAQDEGEQRYGYKQLKSGFQQFTPVVGAVVRLRDRIQHAFRDLEIPGFSTRTEDLFVIEDEE